MICRIDALALVRMKPDGAEFVAGTRLLNIGKKVNI